MMISISTSSSAVQQNRIRAFLFFVITAAAIVQGQQLTSTPSVISDACLACLCEGSSNCNSTIGCVNGLCGPFLISQPYWTDSGAPNGGFARCVQEPFCAAETVRRYMNKFAQDCDGNGVVNCLDYALIHNLGGYGCITPNPAVSNPLYNFVQACFFANVPAGGTGGNNGGPPPPGQFPGNVIGNNNNFPDISEIDLRIKPAVNVGAGIAGNNRVPQVPGPQGVRNVPKKRPSALLTPIAGRSSFKDDEVLKTSRTIVFPS